MSRWPPKPSPPSLPSFGGGGQGCLILAGSGTRVAEPGLSSILHSDARRCSMASAFDAVLDIDECRPSSRSRYGRPYTLESTVARRFMHESTDRKILWKYGSCGVHSSRNGSSTG